MLISIIVPAKNEENNIGELLDTLVIQEQPIEIIVVDANSRDKTREIVKEYMKKYNFIRLYVKEGTRGESMNYAIKKARGDAISFIGADDRAHEEWIKYIRKALARGYEIIAGKCEMRGKKQFEMDRVVIFHKGYDISFPGTNTTYKKEILDKIGGFDTRFVTAEDIDLNYRAVDAGYRVYFEDRAIVYRYSRENAIDFLRQSFWNGYGRKQLSLKYGRLWKSYSPSNTLRTHFSFWGIIRLSFGLLGYLVCKITRDGFK